MALGAALTRERKHGWRVENHGEAMRHERVVAWITRRMIVPDTARHRVCHRVRKMYARVPEADACEGCRKHHARSRLVVVRILHGADQMSRYHPHRLQRPDIADRIRTLIRRPHCTALGSRALSAR